MKTRIIKLILFTLFILLVDFSNAEGFSPSSRGDIESGLSETDDQKNLITFNVSGVLTYSDRDGTTSYGRNYICRVKDDDLYSDDDILWEGETGRDGSFVTHLIDNNDIDGDDGNSLLDVYVSCQTNNTNLQQAVLNPLTRLSYIFYSAILQDVNVTTVNRNINVQSNSDLPAMWIFEDMLRMYEYWDLFSGQDPAAVTTIWKSGLVSYRQCYSTSCYLLPEYPNYPDPEVFIQDPNKVSKDIVVHELAHAYVYVSVGSLGGCEGSHSITGISSLSCAWSEGWAEFLPLFMNSDGCYDFGLGPCSGSFVDLENAGFRDNPLVFNFGEAVEGRIAGALFDLTDGNNEEFDLTGLPLSMTVNVIYSPPLEESFPEFWNNWITAGYGYEHELNSIFFLNTVGIKIYIPLVIIGD